MEKICVDDKGSLSMSLPIFLYPSFYFKSSASKTIASQSPEIHCLHSRSRTQKPLRLLASPNRLARCHIFASSRRCRLRHPPSSPHRLQASACRLSSSSRLDGRTRLRMMVPSSDMGTAAGSSSLSPLSPPPLVTHHFCTVRLSFDAGTAAGSS